MAKDSIYITGWEFNRLLANDPIKPWHSGLPVEMFYQGGYQFWLFKKVYCTKESFTDELHWSESVGWTQGKILNDLRSEGILHPYSLADFKKSESSYYTRFVDGFKQLRQIYPKKRIVQLLKSADASELESIKLKLLKPLFNHLNCVADVTPSSITHWRSKGTQSNMPDSQQDILRLIADPIVNQNSGFKMGLTLCQNPEKWMTSQEIIAHRRAEDEVEQPRVQHFIVGDLSQKDYVEALAPHGEAYRPINQRLLSDWETSREKLLRLRDLAETHIWEDLHKDWLPHLESDPDFRSECFSLIKRAVRHSKMPSFFDFFTFLGICCISAAAGVAAAHVSGAIGQTVSNATYNTLFNKAKDEKKRIEGLMLFYQDACKLRSSGKK